ncbi:hypothetical protein [Streptomyces sp. NPDC046925]|uniref:hypothetical protein n=1 Tax=Streptomyces sp. NPDC046925 TaxID=3155375 RepID=UPI003403C6A7
MTDVITLVSVLAYLIAVLVAVRLVFGRIRQREIDEFAATGRYEEPVGAWNRQLRLRAVLNSFTLAVLWPLTLAAFGAWRMVTSSPPSSEYELKAERDALTRQLKALEKELGIDP